MNIGFGNNERIRDDAINSHVFRHMYSLFGISINGPTASELTANYVSVDLLLSHRDKTYPMGMKAGIFAHKIGLTDKRVSTHVGYTMFFKQDKPKDMRLVQQAAVDAQHTAVIAYDTTAAPASQPVEPNKVEQANEQPKQREISLRMVY